MSSPDIAPADNNGTLGANGHDEKPDVATDSPDELSEDEELVPQDHSRGNGVVNGNGDAGEDSEGGEDLEDEDEDEEDEEGDEDEEEEEPALKYDRLGGIQELLKKDSASALAISNKFLVNTSTQRYQVISF
jgi:vacuolar protein sorting-associated protein 41